MPRFGLILRPASPDERVALGSLKLRASLAWGDHTDELKRLPDAGTVSLEMIPLTFVAECDGRLVGFAAVVPSDHGDVELEDLFVDPGNWRTGIGRALIEEAVCRASAQDAKALKVIAGAKAAAFYEANGFEAVGTIDTLLEPATLMRRCIN